MRTDEKLEEVCAAVQQTCGDLYTAARRVGMSAFALNRWIKEDPVAAERINEAQRVGWMGLEAAAIERAVHGIDKDIYYKGLVVGQEKQYSDTLLKTVMEARIPEYKKGEGGNTFNGPTQINLMPRATNYDEWLAMKTTTLEARAVEQALLAAPAPKVPEILQGEYVEIEDDPMACLRGLGL